MSHVTTHKSCFGLTRRDVPCVVWCETRCTVQLLSWEVPRALQMDAIVNWGSEPFSLLPTISLPPSCTNSFVVAYVLLDTVKKLSGNGFIL